MSCVLSSYSRFVYTGEFFMICYGPPHIIRSMNYYHSVVPLRWTKFIIDSSDCDKHHFQFKRKHKTTDGVLPPNVPYKTPKNPKGLVTNICNRNLPSHAAISL